MPTALAYTFTTQAEMERLFSSSGVSLRIDDLSGGDQTSYLGEVINDATLMVWQYLHTMYAMSACYDSYWVRLRTTWIACHLLSQRRGNPAQFYVRYEEILDELLRVQAGDLIIPDLPFSVNIAPAMSAMSMDEWAVYSKARVEPYTSVNSSHSNQHRVVVFPYDWI